MMGFLVGIGDLVFWFIVKLILGVLVVLFVVIGNIFGLIIYFLVWNIICMGFMWYI